MGGLPSDETRREPPEGDRVEVASIRRDPAAYKNSAVGAPTVPRPTPHTDACSLCTVSRICCKGLPPRFPALSRVAASTSDVPVFALEAN